MSDLCQIAKNIYAEYGQQKEMGSSPDNFAKPYFFLLRTFLGENDLLAILLTKRCRFNCAFCQLPANKPRKLISGANIEKQFEHILYETKHALSILDRITLSNDGSVLDSRTFPETALYSIADAIREIRRVKTLVIETRLEFVKNDVIRNLQGLLPKTSIDILTGFETYDDRIREKILSKEETVQQFLSRLDVVAELNLKLTCYVLYKPDPSMNDLDAYQEANRTVDFLIHECKLREIPLTLRLNPMYLASGSRLAASVDIRKYNPPKLSDIMRLAEEKKPLCNYIYIGLSTESLSIPENTYAAREDYSSKLIKPILLFNNRKISHFNWAELV